MNMLDHYSFPRSLKVLSNLRDLLSCGLCNAPLDKEPVTSGQCGHSFCLACITSHPGPSCPLVSCKMPRWPGDYRQDRTVQQVTTCVLALQNLLGNNQKKEEVPNGTNTKMEDEKENNLKVQNILESKPRKQFEGKKVNNKSKKDKTSEMKSKHKSGLNETATKGDYIKSDAIEDGDKNVKVNSTKKEYEKENDQSVSALKTDSKSSISKSVNSFQNSKLNEPDSDEGIDKSKLMNKAGGIKKKVGKTNNSVKTPKNLKQSEVISKISVAYEPKETVDTKIVHSNVQDPILLSNDANKDTSLVLKEEKVDPKKTIKSSKLSKKRVSLPDKKTNPKDQIVSKRSRGATCEGVTMLNLSISKQKSNLEKKNKKGETPLHAAAARGDVASVQDLLDQGGSPNTWDHAGWTPLHEAAGQGRVELVSMLLQAGARPSVHSAEERVTPMHDAAIGGHVEVVKLLVAHGGDKTARDCRGLTAREVSSNSQVVEVMDQTEVEHVTEVPLLTPGEFVICCDSKLGGSEKSVRELSNAATSLGCGQVYKQLRTNMTHLLVGEGDVTNVDYFSALLSGVEVVNSKWILESRDQGYLVDMSQFRMLRQGGEEGAERARQARADRQPGLLAGIHIYLAGQVAAPYPNKMEVTRLINGAGGKMLTREPDPENIPELERTVAHHGGKEGGLGSECSHLILYQEGGRQEPMIKYNMPHVKTLPIKWLFTSFEQYKLLNSLLQS